LPAGCCDTGALPAPLPNLVSQLVFTALAVVAALTARERVHKIIAPFAGTFFVACIAVLFEHLH
jgi:hypothetical protein